MARTFTDTVNVELSGPDGGMEFTAEVEFSISEYCPEEGPSYACGGVPESGGDIEDLTVTRIYREDLMFTPEIGSPRAPLNAAERLASKNVVTELEAPEWLKEFIVESADKAALVERVAEDLEQDEDYRPRRRMRSRRFG